MTMIPEDIVNEINATAASEEDRLALMRIAESQNPQMARCYVALSRGSMAVLDAVLDANPWAEADYRDFIMLAMNHVDYHSNYFIDPFSPEMKARKKNLGKG